MVIETNQYYSINKVNKSSILVTVHTDEMTEIYWSQLNSDIKIIGMRKADVYFDFMFRNGFKDRYYYITTDEESCVKGSLTSCVETEELRRCADLFFAHNPQFIITSSLTSFQKAFYKNRLKRLFGIEL